MKKKSYLKEMQVILAVRAHLRHKRYTRVGGVRRLTDQGPDITAITPNGKHELFIEAKGGTSSEPGTRRYDKGFTANQKKDHVAKALLEACKQFNQGKFAGIAVPQDHEDLVKDISKALNRLHIRVFLVDSKLHVTETH